MTFRRTGVALVAALAALVSARLPAADTPAGADEDFLKSEKLGTQPAELIALVRRQVVGEAERKQIEMLVAQLGSDSFKQRTEASQQLLAIGWPAVAYLKKAAASPDLEIKSRAEGCLAELEKGPGPALIAAAIRVLAQQQAPGTVKVLLDYFPEIADESIEEEVLTALGRVGVRQGKLDGDLALALKDSNPARRAAVACVLGRAGTQEQRGLVRQLLADPDARVRRYAAHGLLGARVPRAGEPGSLPEEEAVLHKGKLATDAAALLGFFRRRTLREPDLQEVRALIRQLASDRFKEREEASVKLIEFGPGALPLLKEAAKSNDQEVARRADSCVESITTNPGPALPIAALRMLVRRPADEAIATLLDYLPFADDSRVEEEVQTALCLLSTRAAPIDRALVRALEDAHPLRRAGAALVLGRVGGKEECQAVFPLLRDPDLRVCLQASQGLLAAKERSAVEVLINLLAEANLEIAGQAENILQQLAGERAPALSVGDGKLLEQRRKCQAAWLAWWRDKGSTEELGSPDQGPRQLGLTVVAELTGNNADGNRVWEFTSDGKTRWQLTSLQGPIDAHVLPGGRVLIAEHNAQMITERDLKGKVWWEYRVNGNPVACQRLPNGNTFIATYNTVMEITPAKKSVYEYHPNAGVGGVIYDACRLPNGNIICISGRGTLTELDASGKKVGTVQVGRDGGWGGVTPLPGGRFLVALMNPGKVVEVDRNNKVYWEALVPQACHAIRLPNGRTLVACMNIQKVVELNRAGKIVSEKATAGRPFHLHRR